MGFAADRYGVVYFVQGLHATLIKIGYAGDFSARVSAIRSQSPDQIVVLGITPTDEPKLLERLLHEKFQKDRAHREWFKPSPGLLNFIGQHTDPWFDDWWEATPYTLGVALARAEHWDPLTLECKEQRMAPIFEVDFPRIRKWKWDPAAEYEEPALLPSNPVGRKRALQRYKEARGLA